MTCQMYGRLNIYYDVNVLDCQRKYSMGLHTKRVDGHKDMYRRSDSGSDVGLYFFFEVIPFCITKRSAVL